MNVVVATWCPAAKLMKIDKLAQRFFSSHDLAQAGILAGLAFLFLGGVSILPTGRLFLFSLASLCVFVAQLNLGRKKAIYLYLAITALACLISWRTALSFAAFFGIYPLLASYVRMKNNRVTAYLIRIGYGAISLTLLSLFFGNISLPVLSFKLFTRVFWGPFILFSNLLYTVLYDLLMSYLTDLYFSHIRPYHRP